RRCAVRQARPPLPRGRDRARRSSRRSGAAGVSAFPWVTLLVLSAGTPATAATAGMPAIAATAGMPATATATGTSTDIAAAGGALRLAERAALRGALPELRCLPSTVQVGEGAAGRQLGRPVAEIASVRKFRAVALCPAGQRARPVAPDGGRTARHGTG